MSTPSDPFATPQSGGQPTYGTPYEGQSAYGAAPGYGPPPVPGAPYPGWQPAPQTDGKAIAVLVLAICSFVVFPVVPAIVALVLAPGAERDIAASGGRLSGESLVRAGRIVAWINILLAVGTVVALVLFFGLLGAALSAATAG